MRVKVCFTVDVGDFARSVINHRYGRPGLATREQVRDFFQAHGDSGGEMLIGDEADAMEETQSHAVVS